jgi:hypothetical protein
MKNLTIVAILIMMAGWPGQGIENSSANSAGSGVYLIVFTYYRQLIPNLESVTFISNGQAIYATYYNRLKNGALPDLRSHVKRAAGLLFRFATDKSDFREKYVKGIIIPVKLISGERLYFFPEHRLVIEFTGRTHPLPLIRPVFITESKFAVWLRITL